MSVNVNATARSLLLSEFVSAFFLAMRYFFHRERMSLLRGVAHFVPILERARKRANERLYRPGGRGYEVCRVRFEKEARRTSVTLKCD